MGRKRASGEGGLRFDPRRRLWVATMPRAIDVRRPVFYGKTQSEARAKLKRAVRDAERGLRLLNENSRLSEYLDQWLGVLRSRVESGKLAVTTAARYERTVRLHLRPRLGRIPLRRLTPTAVERMFGELQASGLSAATVRHTRATLSRALRDAERDDLIARNVARLTDPPTIHRQYPSAFTVDEFRRIARACADDRLGPLFLFAAHTGLRRSEALGLRWRDVDLDGTAFRVREGLHHISKVAEEVTGTRGLVSSRPKTDASSNPLPLSRAAVRLLNEHHAKQSAERLRCPQPWPEMPADTYVFTTLIGTPLHPSNVSRAWRRILDRAGVPHRTPDGRPRGMHELRRTFATRLRDRGVPVEDVQRLGRWASSKMLLEVYSASDGDRLRSAAEAASEALND